MNDVINADLVSPPNSSSTTSAIGIVIKKKNVQHDDGECNRSYKDITALKAEAHKGKQSLRASLDAKVAVCNGGSECVTLQPICPV